MTTPRREASPTAVLATVGFSVFVAADDLTVVSTMLRPIIGDLGLILPEGLNKAAWIVNAYLIAFVAVMPIAGRLSDVFGRRRTFVAAYLAFLAGSVLIPLSTGVAEPFGWFLAGRVLTALGGGAMVPVALAAIGDAYPVGDRARALGTLGAIETMGWVWGPLYGAMLVRFLSWQWQFWFNLPLALVGLVAVWRVLDDSNARDTNQRPRPQSARRSGRRLRIDWIGAILLTVTLVALNVALLGGAEIQSVNGLDELTGSPPDFRYMYVVALVAGLALVWYERRAVDPILDRRLFAGRNLRLALVVNLVVGAGLVIAMVDVPLFINAVELNIGRAAVVSGWILSALTAAMAVGSYLGGRVTDRWWYRPPVLIGLALSTGAYAWMGATWSTNTSYTMFAAQLAVLGAGFGLTVAPTTSAVVDAAPPDQRGAAASIVMVVRLLGFSVGLSALTAWGLHRFEQLRATISLPPINDPGFQAALIEAQGRLTGQAIAETFTAAAVVVALGAVAALALRRVRLATTPSAATPPPADPAQIRSAPSIALKDFDMEPEPNLPQSAAEVDGDRAVDDQAIETANEGDERDDLVTVGQHLDQGTSADATVRLERRLNVLIGVMGLLLACALGLIALAFARVNSARADASAARAELAATKQDLDRVEAGAALYASQITGFQEQIVALQPQVSTGVEQAVTGLREFSESTITFDVSIDQTIPIDTEVVIDRTVQVPIKTTIPINQSFDTTITIDTPVGRLPLDVTVPVDVEVPIDLVVDIPINETVPISDEFPVKLDVPISIDVGDTELSTLTDSLADGLESLLEVLDGLGG